MYPTAIAVPFELVTYGLMTGVLFFNMTKKNLGTIYISLVVAK